MAQANRICLLYDEVPDLWNTVIWQQLDNPARRALRVTSKATRTLCNQQVDSIKLAYVEGKDIPKVSKAVVAFARQLPRLSSLTLCDSEPLRLWLAPGAGGLFGATPLQGVTSLTISSDTRKALTAPELQQLLATLPNLRSAILSAEQLPETFGTIASQCCPHLTALKLSCNVTDDGQTEDFHVYEEDEYESDEEDECADPPDDAATTSDRVIDVVLNLTALTSLQHLGCNFTFDHGWEADCFKAVTRLTKLQSLSWSCQGVVEETGCFPYPNGLLGLAPLRALTGLTSLTVEGIHGLHSHGQGSAQDEWVISKVMGTLGGMAASLEQLRLPDLWVSREVWAGVFARMPRLKVLVVGGFELCGADAWAPQGAAQAPLKQLRNLEALCVVGFGGPPVDWGLVMQAVPQLPAAAAVPQ